MGDSIKIEIPTKMKTVTIKKTDINVNKKNILFIFLFNNIIYFNK